MACGVQLYFCVSCIAITVEYLVVSPLYTAAMSYTCMISHMACEVQLYFCVSCIAITVEYLVVSPLYTAAMSYFFFSKHFYAEARAQSK